MKKVLFCIILILLSIFPMQSNLCYAKIENYPNKIIKAGSFTLEYGQYKGIETDYDHQIHEIKEKEVFATLTKNKIIINGIPTKYKIKNNKLYVNNIAMYEIIGNNKLLMLAGGGIIFEHE